MGQGTDDACGARLIKMKLVPQNVGTQTQDLENKLGAIQTPILASHQHPGDLPTDHDDIIPEFRPFLLELVQTSCVRRCILVNLL